MGKAMDAITVDVYEQKGCQFQLLRALD